MKMFTKWLIGLIASVLSVLAGGICIDFSIMIVTGTFLLGLGVISVIMCGVGMVMFGGHDK